MQRVLRREPKKNGSRAVRETTQVTGSPAPRGRKKMRLRLSAELLEQFGLESELQPQSLFDTLAKVTEFSEERRQIPFCLSAPYRSASISSSICSPIVVRRTAAAIFNCK